MEEEEVGYTCSSGIVCGGSAPVASYGDPCAACLHEATRRAKKAEEEKAAARAAAREAKKKK